MFFKMKSLLLILFSISLAYPELTEYQIKCARHVNLVRRIRSQDEKIANMNEVKYDVELEEAAKKEKHGCARFTFQKIIKNEMYSTIDFNTRDCSDNPTATKVACIEYYCDLFKSNKTLYIIDKGVEGRITGETVSKCPTGRQEHGLCAVSSKGLVVNGIGVSKKIVMVIFIVVLNFI
ncbi:unnamed protein product [Caenorhabditis nigoni]